MSRHRWRVEPIPDWPPDDAYDVDVTRDTYGVICTCERCGLRVLASKDLMPDEVPLEVPTCRAPAERPPWLRVIDGGG